MTVEELCTRYAAESFPSLAPSTRYQRQLVYRAFAKTYGSLDVRAVTPDLFRAWRDQLAARYAPGTVRLRLDIVHGLFTAAVEEYEVLERNPMDKVRKPPPSRGRERFLSQEECLTLLHACQTSRAPALYPLVLLGVTTGARKNELRCLRWPEVNLVRGMLRFPRTKNGERRAVPLSQDALDMLRAWRQEHASSAWVFPSLNGRQPANISTAWDSVRRRVGLIDFRFHDLRHTAASYLAMSGASLVEIAHILGHKTLRMVQRYSHFTDEHTCGTVERMAREFLTPGFGVPVAIPDLDAKVTCADCGAGDLEMWFTGKRWRKTLCETCYATRVARGTARPSDEER